MNREMCKVRTCTDRRDSGQWHLRTVSPGSLFFFFSRLDGFLEWQINQAEVKQKAMDFVVTRLFREIFFLDVYLMSIVEGRKVDRKSECSRNSFLSVLLG